VPEAVEYGRLIRAQNEVGPLDSSLLGESTGYYTGTVNADVTSML
jgi:hypothetical protein